MFPQRPQSAAGAPRPPTQHQQHQPQQQATTPAPAVGNPTASRDSGAARGVASAAGARSVASDPSAARQRGRLGGIAEDPYFTHSIGTGVVPRQRPGSAAGRPGSGAGGSRGAGVGSGGGASPAAGRAVESGAPNNNNHSNNNNNNNHSNQATTPRGGADADPGSVLYGYRREDICVHDVPRMRPSSARHAVLMGAGASRPGSASTSTGRLASVSAAGAAVNAGNTDAFGQRVVIPLPRPPTAHHAPSATAVGVGALGASTAAAAAAGASAGATTAGSENNEASPAAGKRRTQWPFVTTAFSEDDDGRGTRTDEPEAPETADGAATSSWGPSSARPSSASRRQANGAKPTLDSASMSGLSRQAIDELLEETIRAAAHPPPPPPRDAVAPDDEPEISNMAAIEDVISFFSKTGRAYTPVKFVYLQQTEQQLGQRYRPYDLKVVSRKRYNPSNYYIASSSGVVHMHNGQPTEVASLAAFMREAALFNILAKIPFFRRYLLLKAMEQWRRNIRCKLFCIVRRKLSRNFFLAKKTFASNLVELRKLSMDLSTQPLVRYPTARDGITRERFVAMMAEQKALSVDAFRSTIEAVEGRLRDICTRVSARADVPDLATPEALEQYLLATEEEEAKEKGVRINHRTMPMVRLRESTNRRMRALKAAMDDHTQLPNFIRLIDYLCTEALFTNALLSMRSLNHELLRRDEEKLVFFLIAVSFDQGKEGVSFVPAESEMTRMYTEVSDEVVSTVVSAPRLVSGRQFRDHFEFVPKVFSLGAALREDQRMINIALSTVRLLQNDFGEATAATRGFAKNRRWFSYVQKEWPELRTVWDEKIAAEGRERTLLRSLEAGITPDDFREVFKATEDAFTSIKEMVLMRRGCLVITSSAAADYLQTRLREIQTEVLEKLLALAKSRLERIAATFSARIKSVVERPTALAKFAAFVVTLNSITDDTEALMRAADDIEALYEVGEHNGCEAQDTARRELVLGGPHAQNPGSAMRDRYDEALQSARDFRAASLKDMTKKLSIDIENEKDAIYSTVAMVDGPQLAAYTTEVGEVLTYLGNIEQAVKSSESKMRTFIEWQRLFGIQLVDMQPVEQLRQSFKDKLDLWTTIDRWTKLHETYYATPLAEIDIHIYQKEVDELYAKAYSRLHPRHRCEASEKLLEQLREQKQLMPTIVNFGNKHLKKEHWMRILANQQRAYDPAMSLDSLKQLRMFDVQYRELIAEQSATASGEALLIESIDDVRDKWDKIEFATKNLRDQKDVFILDDVSEIVQQLEEHQLTIQACLASRFVGGIRSRVEEWERKLSRLGAVIEEWVYVQGAWMYLEFIFSSEDIKRQLPTETGLFKVVDADFKELTKRAQAVRNCIIVSIEGDVLEMLQEAHTSLDEIQKRLEDYLETKRAAFPRFYFLSNDELLSILSDVRNPRAVRPHLRKCFDSIKDLVFRNESGTEIDGMISPEGEVVLFTHRVQARGNIETWLGHIEHAMTRSLQDHMLTCHTAYHEGSRSAWILDVQQKSDPMTGHPAQCIQAIDMVQWTFEVEEALARVASSDGDHSALSNYYDAYCDQILDTVKIVRMDLTPLQRTLVGTLLVIDVHNRDTVEQLVQNKVSSAHDFAWNMQLRYYSDSKALITIQHVVASFQYAYEYLGSAKRLVITPLTDRAFLTCTGALHLQLGGAPQGPAGTGKTESVKDLGKALARQVVVFNCSDGINYAMMSQMFAGLAQAGAWACFDEFNRIELEVLSVIAQQMLEISTAIREGRARMTFDGHDIALHPNFGVFITMNPGYAGRTELPDNLKALFRPVCMMIPDYRLIAEIMFFSEGFSNAKTLSVKMVQLYKLSSEQLSKQDHYDFGMRAVKSILVMAGSLKRAEPNEDEDMLLIRAMRDSNLPKFLRDDATLFNALVRDLYPTMEIRAKPNDVVEEAVVAQLKRNDLSPLPLFVSKVLQLYETMVVRHGVMMVGQTLTGKTTCLNVLERALTTLASSKTTTTGSGDNVNNAFFAATHQHIVNPKSVTRDELYGAVNATTREWTDGILSNIVRRVVDAANHASDRHWVVFDGPVDAIWIENMNTVLDDNKMLCLVNGERLKIPDTVSFCFEVQDLKVASPATVSRCGMVFIEPFYLDGGWRPAAHSLNKKMAAKYTGVMASGPAASVSVSSTPPPQAPLAASLSSTMVASVGFASATFGATAGSGGAAAVGKTPPTSSSSSSGLLWHETRTRDFIEAVVPQVLELMAIDCHEWIPSVAAQRVIGMLHLVEALLLRTTVEDDEPAPPVLPRPEVTEDGRVLPTDAVVLDVEEPIERISGTEVDILMGVTPGDSPGSPGLTTSATMGMGTLSSPGGAGSPLRTHDKTLFDMYLAFAFIWGIGGNVSEKSASRDRFSDFSKRLLSRVIPAGFPQDGSVFDYTIHKRSMTWVPWRYKVPQFVYRRSLPFFDLLVPTAETVACGSVVSLLLHARRHVLTNGLTGTGKSVGMQRVLFEELKTEDSASAWQSFGIVMSAQTTSKNVQEKIESKLRKHPSRTKGCQCLGPATEKFMVMYVDDINMPQVEEYGASPPLELLRQIFVQGGFFDRKKCSFKEIVDMSCVASCGPPGGGRNDVTPRLTSRFFMLCQPALSQRSVQKIFQTILTGFFDVFSMEVRGMSAAVAAATLDAFNRICAEQLPRPEKSHYTFNLRDISKVVQGMVQISPAFCSRKEDVASLWVHESSRVFHDRLINEEDRQWWHRTQSTIAASRFLVPHDARWPHLMYGDFASNDVDAREYQPMNIDNALHEVLADKQMGFSIQFSRELDLVLFDDAVHHLTRICRVLRQPRGNALLVGVSGSGRQSLASLGAFIMDTKRFQIAVSKQYSVVEFREDLRQILLETGCEGKPTMFLLSDSQIVKEQFLEDINNVLNTGEVANLWQPEDFDRIMNSVRDAVAEAGKPETPNVMMSHFVTRCRDNLHIVLTMSPVGVQFRNRLRMFPSLVNCMTIDWYSKWPEAALLSVATKAFVAEGPAGEQFEADPQLRDALCAMCVHMHSSVEELSARFYGEVRRRAYTTPTSYLALLHMFTTLLSEQTSNIDTQQGRFVAGVDKLVDANAQVDRMKEQLTRMQPLLEKQAIETEQFAVQVKSEQQAASEVAQVVATEERECSIIMAEAKAIKDDCQSELDKAMPAYYQAVEALNALNPKDISEARAYANPPKKVEMVMDAVLTVLDEDRGWDNARRVMSRPDFIQMLRNYDKDAVSERTLRKLKRFIEMEDFKPEAVQNVSKACVSLCLWCRAIDNYCDVLKFVQPKRDKLSVAEQKLAKAQHTLNEKQSQLRKVEEKVALLKAQFQSSMDTKKSLEAEKERTEIYLHRAGRLVSALSSEYERWKQCIGEFNEKRHYVVGFSLLAAGMIAYSGPFSGPYRKQLLDGWHAHARSVLGIVVPDEVKLQEVIEAVMIRHWNVKGLPSDNFSVQNGSIVSKSTRWCLCIDPEGQANAWIKNMYRDRGLKVMKMTDANLIRTLEQSVRLGTPVLIENVGEELDAALDPVLQRQTFKQGGRLMIRVRDAPVEYDPNFFLILTTRIPNPHYLPEVQIKLTLVNFTVTTKGLEDQLLAQVVRSERRELEERADRLIVQVADAKAQLTEVEEKLLRLLSSTGDILANDNLINTLEYSKSTSHEIQENLATAEVTAAEISAAREKYRCVATRGSIVYATISETSGLQHMYQNNLAYFSKLFNQTLARTAPSEDVSARCASLISNLTLNGFTATCRGMFESDKPTMAFLLAVAIKRQEGAITDAEWLFFLRGAGGNLVTSPREPVEWGLPEQSFEELQYLEATVPGLEGLCDAIESHPDVWSGLYQDAHASLPQFMLDLSIWQRMLVMRSFREERIGVMAREFVIETLGKEYQEPPAFDLAASFADSSPSAPILIVLSPGTDPTLLFNAFADHRGFNSRKLMLSLGQNQGVKAEAMIARALKTGEWVYLQNCHVYTSWMPRLEQLVEELGATSDPHPDFRLWMTTMPSDNFPVPVLQTCVKVTREPPTGLKANLRDTLNASVDSATWNSVTNNVTDWHRLVFSLTLFHGVVQERRRFGPLGWNVLYEWNSGDLDASLKALRGYVQDFDTIPWDAVQYMLGNINYGGRVTDSWDLRCLTVIMSQFVGPHCLESNAASFGAFTRDGLYVIPSSDSLDDVLEYVNQLPLTEAPEIFGLHSNADLTMQVKDSRFLMRSIVEVQPRQASAGAAAGSGGSGGSGDNSAVTVVLQDFLSRLPPHVERAGACPDTYRITESGAMVSLGTVAMQEIDRLNILLEKLRHSLVTLQKALKGEVVMDRDLEQTHSSITFGLVPRAWEKAAYPSLKPLASWFVDLINRVEFFRDWNDSGPPTSYWLGAFFFPQGFLTGVLQTHARQYKVPIDHLRFQLHVTSEVDENEGHLELINTGVYVHGLFMEGARWDVDAACLQESHPRQLFSKMPIIWLEPVATPDTDTTSYDCPIYKISSRAGTLSTTGLSTNFILSVKLNPGSVESQNHWTQRGTALLTTLDD